MSLAVCCQMTRLHLLSGENRIFDNKLMLLPAGMRGDGHLMVSCGSVLQAAMRVHAELAFAARLLTVSTDLLHLVIC